MRYLIYVLVLSSFSYSSDLTVWNYDLTTLPEGWVSTGSWEFDSLGAHVELVTMGDAPFVSSIYTEILRVPEGSDSLTLYVPQYSTGGGSDGGVSTKLELYLNDEEMVMLWKHTWVNTWQTDTQPIVESVDVAPGDSLYFRFEAHASAVGTMGWAELYWQLNDLELVLHGDFQALSPLSWGLLKSKFTD